MGILYNVGQIVREVSGSVIAERMNFNGFCHDFRIVNKKCDWLVISSLNSYWFIVEG